ncbi:hypothetical protein GS4_02_00220 [Gordonia soli NBRC 108243]|uniref:Phosphoenolpyruvate guanylyltransferase n=2 Tax=Gordonia soli TaxID=320799 RepID=M0QFY7_9ACTN|nr:hypothetical protein GS4_02_00220 [Gordonia soli NBRC 108243]
MEGMQWGSRPIGPMGLEGVAAVLAVKDLDSAKTRLAASLRVTGHCRHRAGGTVGAHRDLVLAMLADTIGALGAAGVADIAVVTPDDAVLRVAAEVGAIGIRERPAVDHGHRPVHGKAHSDGFTSRGVDPLNRAYAQGAMALSADRPGVHTMVLVQADLPAATPRSLREVLAAAAGHRQAVLGDRDGTGTTLLVRDASESAPPRFGVDSLTAHINAGAIDLDPTGLLWPDLRTDVDTATDLDAARLLGLGPRTIAVLDPSQPGVSGSVDAS